MVFLRLLSNISFINLTSLPFKKSSESLVSIADSIIEFNLEEHTTWFFLLSVGLPCFRHYIKGNRKRKIGKRLINIELYTCH